MNLAFQFVRFFALTTGMSICLNHRALLKIKPELSTINEFPQNDAPVSHMGSDEFYN